MGGFNGRAPNISADGSGPVFTDPSEQDEQRASDESGNDPMAGAWDDWARQMDDFTSRIGPMGHETAVWDVDPPPPPEAAPPLSKWGADALPAIAGALGKWAVGKGTGELLQGSPLIVRFGSQQMAKSLVPSGRGGLERDFRIWQAWQLYNSVQSYNHGLRSAEVLNGIPYRHDFD